MDFTLNNKCYIINFVLTYNKKLKHLSRNLRKNMTDAENLLWSKLKSKQMLGFQFYRQKTIGNYIVDFYCPKSNLVIEIDGGEHYSEKKLKSDEVRDNYMEENELTVLRYSDLDVLQNLEIVLEDIFKNINPP